MVSHVSSFLIMPQQDSSVSRSSIGKLQQLTSQRPTPSLHLSNLSEEESLKIGTLPIISLLNITEFANHRLILRLTRG